MIKRYGVVWVEDGDDYPKTWVEGPYSEQEVFDRRDFLYDHGFAYSCVLYEYHGCHSETYEVRYRE